jgi:hypothetical protein
MKTVRINIDGVWIDFPANIAEAVINAEIDRRERYRLIERHMINKIKFLRRKRKMRNL